MLKGNLVRTFTGENRTVYYPYELTPACFLSCLRHHWRLVIAVLLRFRRNYFSHFLLMSNISLKTAFQVFSHRHSPLPLIRAEILAGKSRTVFLSSAADLSITVIVVCVRCVNYNTLFVTPRCVLVRDHSDFSMNQKRYTALEAVHRTQTCASDLSTFSNVCHTQ
jgi:hypothetical protein